MSEKTYEVSYVEGVEGNSLYLDDTRFAGRKPWGGGRVLKIFKVRKKDLEFALRGVIRPILPEKEEAEIAKNFVKKWLEDKNFDHHQKHWGQSIDEFFDYCEVKLKGEDSPSK